MALQLTGDRLTLGKLIKRYTQVIFVSVSPPLFKNGDKVCFPSAHASYTVSNFSETVCIDMAGRREGIRLPITVWRSKIRRIVESTGYNGRGKKIKFQPRCANFEASPGTAGDDTRRVRTGVRNIRQHN